MWCRVPAIKIVYRTNQGLHDLHHLDQLLGSRIDALPLYTTGGFQDSGFRIHFATVMTDGDFGPR